eukprot:COSAG05_NODE_3537_length_2004_cov_4.482168_4_plen_164_part_00
MCVCVCVCVFRYFIVGTVNQDRQVWEHKLHVAPRNIVPGDGPFAGYNRCVPRIYTIAYGSQILHSLGLCTCNCVGCGIDARVPGVSGKACCCVQMAVELLRARLVAVGRSHTGWPGSGARMVTRALSGYPASLLINTIYSISLYPFNPCFLVNSGVQTRCSRL